MSSMNRYHRTLEIVGALLLAMLVPSLCRADGFIVIHDPPTVSVPGHFAFAPLEVTYHRVTVEIHDNVATTSVDQDFYNPNPQRLEGTYLFPLPEGSHIDKFSMDINGKMMDAELLSADKARSIYEEIVRKMKDPALLEYAGRDAFKVRIFPIEPHSHKPIKLQYTQLLKTDAGLTEYTYPLNTEKFSARPLKDISIKLTLDGGAPLKSVYCPTHNVEVRRDGDRRAVVGYETHNVRPDTDFKVLFSKTEKAVGLDLLTYRTGSSEEGYFLLLASPGMEAPKGAVQKKDICFVIDTSGSMADNGGKKMEQAKKALSFCLQNLGEEDRFEIVRFSTEAEPLFNRCVEATKENVAKGQAFVSALRPIGGTAISDALQKAIEAKPSRHAHDKYTDAMRKRDEAPYEVIFITDGQPTIGDTSEDSIVGAINRAEKEDHVRIFSFGLGTDVNTHLLDRIAGQTHAFSQYVLPEEDLEVKLGSFYTKIKEPVLSNVQLAVTGADIKVSQLYPGAMPDLFKGEQLIAFGRYSGHGAAAIKISGTLNGEKQEFVQDATFAESDTKNGFIPRLWATRRVGYLLDQIRLNGENKELKEEVTRLAREHGIVTPYTAFLILEDEQRRGVPLASQTFRELDRDAPAKSLAGLRYNSAKDEANDARLRAGGQAVANARDVDDLKTQSSLERKQEWGELSKRPAAAPAPTRTPRDPAAPPATAEPSSVAGTTGGSGGGGLFSGSARADGPAEKGAAGAKLDDQNGAFGYRKAQNYAQQARIVRGRAFYQNGNTWSDATAQEALAKNKALKQRNVKFNSDEYFALLKEHPEAAQWLSLGNEVDVLIGEELIMVR